MESLAALSRELGHPSVTKLYETAQRRGMDVTRKAVEDFVKIRDVVREKPKKAKAALVDNPALAALSAELGQPSAKKLYEAAQRRGLDVANQAVDEFVRGQ